MTKIKHSSGDDKHPYMKIKFWENPTNQYWENETHTESSKVYHREWLASLRQRERRLTNLGKMV